MLQDYDKNALVFLLCVTKKIFVLLRVTKKIIVLLDVMNKNIRVTLFLTIKGYTLTIKPYPLTTFLP